MYALLRKCTSCLTFCAVCLVLVAFFEQKIIKKPEIDECRVDDVNVMLNLITGGFEKAL